MTKIALLLTSLFFITSTFAQKFKIGITAGPTIVSNTGSNKTINNGGTANDRTVTKSSLVSFKVGIVGSLPISNFISFRPELTYLGKGVKNHHDYVTGTDFDTKMTSNWIELPLDFVYNIPTKNGRFFIGLGPYVSCALSATLHNTGDTADIKVTFSKAPSDAGTSRSAIYANRIDAGANIIAGYEFRNSIFINLNYSHGFINFRNDIVNSPSNKNTVLGLSIGYMFK